MNNNKFPLNVLLTPDSLSQLDNDAGYVRDVNLLAGENVTLSKAENGNITISSTGGGGGTTPKYTFFIKDGHLFVRSEEGQELPYFYIDERGHLMMVE